MINRSNIGSTEDDRKNNIVVIIAIELITTNSKVKLEINKILTKQIHFP